MEEKVRVLICEDEKSINDQFAELLQLSSFEVSQSYKRDETLSLIQHKFFDVALIDLDLEGKTNPIWRESGGIHILKYLKEQNYGTIPIVVTGNPETRLAFELARDFCVMEYVAKGLKDTAGQVLSAVKEFSSKIKVNYPGNTALFMSGIRDGNDREIWTTNCLSALALAGGANTLSLIFDTIVKNVYPMKANKNGFGMRIDDVKKMLFGSFWSLQYDSAIDIWVVRNKDDIALDSTVLVDKKIKNVHLIIAKSDSTYDDFS